MERENVLSAITKELGIGEANAKLLANFTEENKELGEFEFYDKLKKTFPWFELAFRYKNLSNLSKIEKHLYFFKMLTIISIVFGVIALIVIINP